MSGGVLHQTDTCTLMLVKSYSSIFLAVELMRLLKCMLNSVSVIGWKLSANTGVNTFLLELVQFVPWAGLGCAWCPAPRGGGRAPSQALQNSAAWVSEQQFGFESSFSHLLISNSLKIPVVLVSLYVSKGTWSNLAGEPLWAAREEKVLAWFSGPYALL